MPGGGPEMTGVLVLGGSLLLHPANNKQQRRNVTQRRKEGRKGAKKSVSSLRLLLLTLRLCVKTASDLFLMVPPARRTFIWFLWKRLTGDAILAFDPLAEVDELAPLRTEGTKRIVFPLD